MENDRIYAIINTSESGSVNFDQVLQTSIDTVRKSNDGTKMILKWINGNTPDFIKNIENISGPYSHKEITDILNGDEWYTGSVMFEYNM